MQNPEPVLENETFKIPWEFKILANNLMSVRWPDLGTVNKKAESAE